MENIKQLHAATLADWGPVIETATRRIAAVLVAVYVAGYVAGTWLHRLNDRLSRAYVAFLGLSEPTVTATQRPAEAPVSAPEPVQWAVCYGLRSDLPAAVAPPSLDRLTVAELRKMARAAGHKTAGGRRIAQAAKSALLEIL